MTVILGRLSTQIEYPSFDGEPMAESDLQRQPLTYAVKALDFYFQERSDVYVSLNLLIYAEAGARQAAKAGIAELEAQLRATRQLPTD